MLKFYSNPKGAGWIGWIERDDKAVAFIGLDWKVVFMDELG